MTKKFEDKGESTSKGSGEDRIARHGFFLNENLHGTTEGEELAIKFADLIKSMQESPPSDPDSI